MTCKEPDSTPRRRSWCGPWSGTRPAREPEEVRIFVEEVAVQRTACRLARVFPKVDVVPWQDDHAVLTDGCPYLTIGRVSLKPMPTG